MNTTTKTKAALTYAESRLVAGNLDAGIIAGFLAENGRVGVIRGARAASKAFRAPFGYASSAPMLTEPESQPKLGKSERHALGLMLTPAASLDVGQFLGSMRPVNVCPRASSGCMAACLAYSGHGQFNKTQRARQVRHAFLIAHPYEAGVLMGREIRVALDAHGADEMTFRFNTLSEYRIERIIPNAMLLMAWKGVRLYDYTAWAPEDRDTLGGLYHLTYSAKEPEHTSDKYLADLLRAGENVAMPFNVLPGELPTEYVLDGQTFRVIDGDLSDDRTEDDRGVLVGLSAKGPLGKADTSGFVREPQA